MMMDENKEGTVFLINSIIALRIHNIQAIERLDFSHFQAWLSQLPTSRSYPL